MRLKILWMAVLFGASTHACFAQDDLFQAPVKEAKHGFLTSVGFIGEWPFADMSKRFGMDFRIGPLVQYKTKSNWYFGAKADFILGGNVKEDSLLINVRDQYNSAYNINGERVDLIISERGYTIGLLAGKLFSFNNTRPDNGILTTIGFGFIQHKINIKSQEKSVSQLEKPYIKGYDRLTNGWYVEPFVGYNFYSKSGLINFTAGVDMFCGFTKGRRSYLYDVMRPDQASRLDMMGGLKLIWNIPMFRRNSEDIFYE